MKTIVHFTYHTSLLSRVSLLNNISLQIFNYLSHRRNRRQTYDSNLSHDDFARYNSNAHFSVKKNPLQNEFIIFISCLLFFCIERAN